MGADRRSNDADILSCFAAEHAVPPRSQAADLCGDIMMNICRFSLVAALALLPGAAPADDIDPYDQSKVPLEVEPKDPSLTKIVLVAGRQSHGPGDHEFFAGSALLMNFLKQTPGVFPVMARDGWPKDEK